MHSGIRLSAMGLTVSALVALYGCSSSDDGGGTSSTPSVRGGTLVTNVNVQEARHEAAGGAPVTSHATSISHSSDRSVMSVLVEENLEGDLEYSLILDSGELANTADGDEKTRLDRVHGEDADTLYFDRFETEGDVHGVDIYRSIGETDTSGLPPGDLWVRVYTNFDGTAFDENDYIAGGIWVFIPTDEDNEEVSFGVFADGAAPVADGIEELEGTATYEGSAFGLYSHGRRSEAFEAAVELMADFDAVDAQSATVGNIGGRIYDFMVDGDELEENLELTLSTVLLNDMNHFSGDTDMTYNDESFTGTWAGRFYNDPDDQATGVGDHPEAVAGTFGAINGDEDESFIGVFGAQLEPPPTN